MCKIANALISIQASRQVAGSILFKDDMPHKALFETVTSETAVWESPYLQFYHQEDGSFKVTLAYFNSKTGEYAYPYYVGNCSAASDCFLVNPENESDVIILNIGAVCEYDKTVAEVQKKIDDLYGDMGI